MDLNKFLGRPVETEQDYLDIIEKLGGPDALEHLIPFDIETLKKAYSQNKHFNTNLTPLSKWDAATGLMPRTMGYKIDKLHGVTLSSYMRRFDITWAAPSQCVCILKYAAELLVKNSK